MVTNAAEPSQSCAAAAQFASAREVCRANSQIQEHHKLSEFLVRCVSISKQISLLPRCIILKSRGR